jgi:penicillin-insensitive murein endopeptidase
MASLAALRSNAQRRATRQLIAVDELGGGNMRWGRKALLALPLLAAGAFIAYVAWLGVDSDQPSRCFGGNAAGRLEGGRRLPYSGENFTAYSPFGFVMGRTFMHRSVRDAVRDAYADLARSNPELRFVYAEASWPWGARLWPHRTHNNGTAVDFHVPVRTESGAVATSPASIFNLFGYGLDFDKSGRSGSYHIDFEAIALHLLALDKAARAHGISIRRVIFDMRLHSRLFAAKSGTRLRRTLPFNVSQAWVRHDEHYHVEFNVRCQ